MRKTNNKESFWPSYVDIMTTLFAIMVVLFVATFSWFKVKQKELLKFKDKYKELEAIYQMVEDIDPVYFDFNEEYVKHIFKIQVTYQRGEYDLYKLKADRYDKSEADSLREQIKKAGYEIKRTIDRLESVDTLKQDIKYLVVIEGQASADGFAGNDVLSYQRALELSNFWKHNGIDFSSMNKCELIVSGSGEGGVPRECANEELNQRFLIHIVPVIGNISLKQLAEP